MKRVIKREKQMRRRIINFNANIIVTWVWLCEARRLGLFRLWVDKLARDCKHVESSYVVIPVESLPNAIEHWNKEQKLKKLNGAGWSSQDAWCGIYDAMNFPNETRFISSFRATSLAHTPPWLFRLPCFTSSDVSQMVNLSATPSNAPNATHGRDAKPRRIAPFTINVSVF